MSEPRPSTCALAFLLTVLLLISAPPFLARTTGGASAGPAAMPAVPDHLAAASLGDTPRGAGSMPVADFVSDTQGMAVLFNASASSAPLGRSIDAYSWAFGDGTTSSGMSASHTYTAPGRYSVVLVVTDSTSVRANTSRYVSVAPTTVDIRFDDMFQADCPYGAWWNLRFHTYGDVILNNSAPCTDYYPWVLYSQAQGAINPSWVYTLFHMSADVTNFPGYSVAEPVMLPVFNYSAAPGQYIYYNFTFNYLDSAAIAYWDTTQWPVNAKYSDGFGYLVRGNITMDLQESRRVFGVEASTPAQAQSWWWANTKYGGGVTGRGLLENQTGAWLNDVGNTKYDIYNAFQWYSESDIADLNATVNPTTGQTTVRVFLDGWGLDVLLSRWFYWGNVSYRDVVNAPYGRYAPAGWMPFERCTCENVTVNATIRSSLNLDYSGVHAYDFAAVGMPGPDGVLGTSDDLAGWAYGPYLIDYVPPVGSGLPGASQYPNSELKWYEPYTHPITSPGSYAYGLSYEYIEVPARWNMTVGHSLTIAMPTADLVWYDPVKSTWNPTNAIGNYVTFRAPLTLASVQPGGGYYMWDGNANVLSIAAPPGFSWPNDGTLPLEPAPYIVFEPNVDYTPPVTTANFQGTAGSNPWFLSNVTVTLGASDTGSGVNVTLYRIDGGAWTPYTQPVSVHGSGTHSLQYYSVDLAGNAEAPKSRSVRIDLTEPVITWSPPSTVTASTVTLGWTGSEAVSEIAGYEINVDGDGFRSLGLSTSTSLTLADGAHVVQLRATSGAGSTTTVSASFTVNTSFFSFSGPYAGLLIMLILIAVAAVVGVVLLIRAMRRSARPPEPPAPPPTRPPP